jgi:hypothetical protein
MVDKNNHSSGMRLGPLALRHVMGHFTSPLLLSLFCCSLVTGFLSSLALFLLSQWWTPPLRLQVSACSTFLMTCDVPSMAVFCRESIECCLGIVSRYFCKLLLTVSVPRWLLVWQSISCSTFAAFLYVDDYYYYYYYYYMWFVAFVKKCTVLSCVWGTVAAP